MYQIVFDADGLIKVHKGGFLGEIAGEYICLLPDEVFREAIVAARQTHAEEAKALEALIHAGKLQRRPPARSARAARILAMFQALGTGEQGALRLFLKEKAEFTVTDDRAFLNVLVRNRTPFLTPAELLVRLRRAGGLSREDAESSAGRLRPYIRREVYQELVQRLGDIS